MKSYSLSLLADLELLRDLAASVAQDRCTTAMMLAQIAEVDTRRLYAPAACESMFEYCVRELRMSEDTAAKRIRAARTAGRFPAIFAALADGRLNLSGVLLLAAHLTDENAADLLGAAAHRTNAQIERLLAERFPQPDIATLITPVAPTSAKCLPAVRPVGMTTSEQAAGPIAMVTPTPAPVPSRLTPLAPETYALQTTLRKETYEKLQRLCALLGHAVPTGDMDAVLGRAFDLAIAAIERQKFGVGSRTRAGSRRGRTMLT